MVLILLKAVQWSQLGISRLQEIRPVQLQLFWKWVISILSGFSIPFYSQHLDLLSLMSPFQTLQKGRYGNLLLTLHTLVLNYL